MSQTNHLASTLPHIDEDRRVILVDLFRSADPFSRGVSRKAFRVKHHERYKVVDQLLRDGEVIEHDGRYRASLLALSTIEYPEVLDHMADCDCVLKSLRKRYLENPEDQVSVEVLAENSGIGSERYRRALAFLSDTYTVLGVRNGFSLDEPSCCIVPGDVMLEIKDLQALLVRLKEHKASTPRAHYLLSAANAGEASRPLPVSTWQSHLPPDLRDLMLEMQGAHNNGYRRLTAMGIRAAIDMWCDDVVKRDVGSFDRKLDLLTKAQAITETQKIHLKAVVEVGHASAHRGHSPSLEDVQDCFDLLERSLKAHYCDPTTAKRLNEVTPRRKPPEPRSPDP